MTDPNSRIEDALSQLGSEHVPPEGWEDRVLAATKQHSSRPWWVWTTPLVVLAVILLVLVLPGSHALPPPHKLEIALADLSAPGAAQRAGRAMRAAGEASSDASMGDVGGTGHAGEILHAVASGGRGFRSLWIYRDDVLVMACPGDARCQVSADQVAAELTLATGAYKLIELVSMLPLPPPTGAFDRDIGRAMDAGARDLRRHIDVP